MREIKFRAWDFDLGEMSHFDLIGLACCDSYLFKPSEFPDSPFKPQKGKSLEIMQYTGLKDKNGKEIYDGDIIQVGAGVLFSTKLTVEFIKYSWCLTAKDYIDTFNNTKSEHIKVIGNIYENSELLEK